MSTKPKFDPSRVASLLNRGTEEGRGQLAPAPAPVLASVPASVDTEAPTETATTDTDSGPTPPGLGRGAAKPRARTTAAEPEAAEVAGKRPITVRLSEEVIHALVRHQAELRCKPGVRLGESTIGGVMDSLLRGPLGLPAQ
jgi:hypothetical protein